MRHGDSKGENKLEQRSLNVTGRQKKYFSLYSFIRSKIISLLGCIHEKHFETKTKGVMCKFKKTDILASHGKG